MVILFLLNFRKFNFQSLACLRSLAKYFDHQTKVIIFEEDLYSDHKKHSNGLDIRFHHSLHFSKSNYKWNCNY